MKLKELQKPIWWYRFLWENLPLINYLIPFVKKWTGVNIYIAFFVWGFVQYWLFQVRQLFKFLIDIETWNEIEAIFFYKWKMDSL